MKKNSMQQGHVNQFQKDSAELQSMLQQTVQQ